MLAEADQAGRCVLGGGSPLWHLHINVRRCRSSTYSELCGVAGACLRLRFCSLAGMLLTASEAVVWVMVELLGLSVTCLVACTARMRPTNGFLVVERCNAAPRAHSLQTGCLHLAGFRVAERSEGSISLQRMELQALWAQRVRIRGCCTLGPGYVSPDQSGCSRQVQVATGNCTCSGYCLFCR